MKNKTRNLLVGIVLSTYSLFGLPSCNNSSIESKKEEINKEQILTEEYAKEFKSTPTYRFEDYKDELEIKKYNIVREKEARDILRKKAENFFENISLEGFITLYFSDCEEKFSDETKKRYLKSKGYLDGDSVKPVFKLVKVDSNKIPEEVWFVANGNYLRFNENPIIQDSYIKVCDFTSGEDFLRFLK